MIKERSRDGSELIRSLPEKQKSLYKVGAIVGEAASLSHFPLPSAYAVIGILPIFPMNHKPRQGTNKVTISNESAGFCSGGSTSGSLEIRLQFPFYL